MKKIFLLILFASYFQQQAQNSSFGLSTVFTYFDGHFYRDHTVTFQPGFDISYHFLVSENAEIFSGLEFGYYRGGLKHVSNNIIYDLHLRTWHFSIPFYRRFSVSEKWQPRVGFTINIPFSTTYTYEIYDGEQNIYHNTDKPVKENFLDLFQLQVGFEYLIKKQWWWNFQINYLGSAQISTGIKYFLPAQTKK